MKKRAKNLQIIENKESHGAMQEVVYTYLDKISALEKNLASDRKTMAKAKKEILDYRSGLAEREQKISRQTETIHSMSKEQGL